MTKAQEELINEITENGEDVTEPGLSVIKALRDMELGYKSCILLFAMFGEDAPKVCEEDPYALIELVDGFGFQKADKLALRFGIKKENPSRIRSGILFLLEKRAQEGDSYAPLDDFKQSASELLEVEREAIEDEMVSLAFEGAVAVQMLAGEKIIMLHRYYRAENYCAGKLFSLASEELEPLSGNIPSLVIKSEKSSGIELSEGQRDAVTQALQNGVFVITGGPGTGKTTIINIIIKVLEYVGAEVALTAPTGRAAKRMTEACGKEAKTIHRLLEYAYSEDDDYMRFMRSEENPLDQDVIIIDEMSMVDVLLMESLLRALKPGTRLILVGDSDQLPCVGAGTVLKDVLSCEYVPCKRLNEIYRQAEESLIVVNAHRINGGFYPYVNEKDKDFFFIRENGLAETAASIENLVKNRLPSFYEDLDPMSDFQVLTPTKKGLLGSTELNARLREVLNPASEDKKELSLYGKRFREGDRVIQTRNNYRLEWKSLTDMSDGEGVFNGEMGRVLSIDPARLQLTVLFDDRKTAQYSGDEIDQLECAYALTVHKSQGCEFPLVIIPMARFAPMLSTRNLLYTAVTRAKTAAVLVGNPAAMMTMVDNDSVAKRCSGLGKRLDALWQGI